VKTPNGGSTSLTILIGKHFTANQLITFDNDTEIELGDKSFIKLTKGSKIKLDGCSFSSGSTTPFIRFSLLLGKIWSKVVPNSEHMQIKTERTVNGVRGTIFWVAYAHGVSTLHVDRGSVSLSPVSGKGRWKTVIVTAGHTATQRGTKAPVVRRAPINLNPPS
jgi:ferric-dicitrate binding protein FerR (iron transport regulator)